MPTLNAEDLDFSQSAPFRRHFLVSARLADKDETIRGYGRYEYNDETDEEDYIPGEDTNVLAGQWVVYRNGSVFAVMDDAEFQETYRRIERDVALLAAPEAADVDDDEDFDGEEYDGNDVGYDGQAAYELVSPMVRIHRLSGGDTLAIGKVEQYLDTDKIAVMTPDENGGIGKIALLNDQDFSDYWRCLSDGTLIGPVTGDLASQAANLRTFAKKAGMGLAEGDIGLHSNDLLEVSYRKVYPVEVADHEDDEAGVNVGVKAEHHMTQMQLYEGELESSITDEQARAIAMGMLPPPADHAPRGENIAEVNGFDGQRVEIVNLPEVIEDRPLPTELPGIVARHMEADEMVRDGHVGFRQIKTLPPFMVNEIRKHAEDVFTQLTNVPLHEIQVIMGSGDGGQAVNELGSWLERNGEARVSGATAAFKTMPGYSAEIDLFGAAGCGFLKVRDFMGSYVYAWPERRVPDPELNYDEPRYGM